MAGHVSEQCQRGSKKDYDTNYERIFGHKNPTGNPIRNGNETSPTGMPEVQVSQGDSRHD